MRMVFGIVVVLFYTAVGQGARADDADGRDGTDGRAETLIPTQNAPLAIPIRPFPATRICDEIRRPAAERRHELLARNEV